MRCHDQAALWVEQLLALPSWPLRLVTVPMTQLWWTPSLRVLQAGGPEAFVLGITRGIVDIYDDPCDAEQSAALVKQLGVAPSSALIGLWYAVFFAIPLLGALLADVIAMRWTRTAARAVIAAQEGRTGGRPYAESSGRDARIAAYLRRPSGR